VRYANWVTMRKKANYDKKVRLTRILLSDYLVLKQISQAAGVSMAAALHSVLHQLKPEKKVSPAQIPMPVWTVLPRPSLHVETRPVIAVNGNKQHVAYKIKPKGGVNHA